MQLVQRKRAEENEKNVMRFKKNKISTIFKRKENETKKKRQTNNYCFPSSTMLTVSRQYVDV